MYKNITTIEAEEMAWNEHDQQLDTQIKTSMPSWQKNRMGTYNMTKQLWHIIQSYISQLTNGHKHDY